MYESLIPMQWQHFLTWYSRKGLERTGAESVASPVTLCESRPILCIYAILENSSALHLVLDRCAHLKLM